MRSRFLRIQHTCILHARSDHLSPGHPLAVAAPASRALVETGPHCTLGLDLVFACGRKAWQRLLFFPNTSESHPLLKQQRLQTSIKSSSAYIQVQTITPVTTVSFVKNILNSASTLEVYCSDCCSIWLQGKSR